MPTCAICPQLVIINLHLWYDTYICYLEFVGLIICVIDIAQDYVYTWFQHYQLAPDTQ